jgi:MFS family permease
MAFGAIAYIAGGKFWQFMIGETLFACGMSFKSGSDTAIVYDSLKKLNNEKSFTTIQGKGEAYALASQIIGSVVSGFAFSINKELPLMISAVLLLGSAITALFLFEIKTFEHEEKPGYIKQIKISGQFLLSHQRVRSIVLYGIFFFMFFRIGFWYYQPYLQAISIKPEYFGIIFALYNIVATLSARNAGKFVQRTKGKSMILLSVLMAASFILLGMTRLPFGFLFICLQQVARGVQVPVFMKYLNKHIPSNQRATIISFSSLLKNLAAAAVFPVAGFFMDRIDAVQMNLYTGLIMTAGAVFFYFFLKKQMKRRITESERILSE